MIDAFYVPIEKTKKALEELGYTIANVVEGDWDIVEKFSGGGINL